MTLIFISFIATVNINVHVELTNKRYNVTEEVNKGVRRCNHDITIYRDRGYV